MSVQDLLKVREKTHGKFKDVARVSQAIKDAIAQNQLSSLPDYVSEGLDNIAGKIARIVMGDHKFLDHWTDIAGYATLVLEELRKQPASSLPPLKSREAGLAAYPLAVGGISARQPLSANSKLFERHLVESVEGSKTLGLTKADPV